MLAAKSKQVDYPKKPPKKKKEGIIFLSWDGV